MRFSPGCTCCDANCWCGMRCWPWPNDPWAYYVCIRPPPGQIRERCYDLVLYKLLVTVDPVTSGTCASCTYGGTHCLVYVSHTLEIITTPNPSGPPTQEWYYSEVIWESERDAECGPVIADPLPALTVKFTDDGTTAKWTLYLNTTDTLGGVATYEIDASSWQCGYDNTLTKKTDSGQCTVPSAATVGPCEHCLLCTESTPRRMIYEWQITASGFGDVPGSDCTTGQCASLDGTWILGPGIFRVWYPGTGEPIIDQCEWSLRTDYACATGTLTWSLKVDDSSGTPTLILGLFLDGVGGTSVATWKAPFTSCTASVTFTLDADYGICSVPSTISGTPL